MSYVASMSHATASIYIAGPEVLYVGGNDELTWMRGLAAARGFTVTLPNDTAMSLGNADPRLDADTIFANCATSMNASDTLICDLDFYRGTEPDGGSIYEIGMAYARGMRIIGFTRDKRSMAIKDPRIVLRDGLAFDADGRRFPYADLPFAPSVVGSTKIVEGDFDDALRQLQLDLEEQSKDQVRRPGRDGSPVSEETRPRGDRPRVYVASPDRFRVDAADYYRGVKELGAGYGWQVLTPLDDVPGVERVVGEDRWASAYSTFDRCQQLVRSCDVIIADLNDYHGLEPNSDTSFECGFGFQLGKRLFGYMSDTRRMIDRIPNLGPQFAHADLAGAKAETFDYPINLMFASSMPIFEGKLEDIAGQVAALLTES